MLAAVRESIRNAARWCTGRAKWGSGCRRAIVPRAGACRSAPLASGSWVKWLCYLGASGLFGGPKHRERAYLSVKTTDLRTVRDGVAVLAVRLRWEPRDAARPLLGALHYEARRWGLRLAVLPRSKVDQMHGAVTSLLMRQADRVWRRKVQSGKWRVERHTDYDVLVPTGRGAS